ncbi:MAG: site-specific DNA-methyltransferase [Muribaculum sp.]|nr:site-specific DNA-methyltransferase [Muribaculum sp.]
MNKAELARKIQALEGLDNEEKAALLDLLRSNKKYGLVWEEKPEDIEDRLRDELPVLIERNDYKVHSIISDDPEAPNHFIIEGDNLAALTELSYTHAGKIDVIYIDPPYNTGHKDFAYNDSYVDTEDEYRHSKWLSFMSKRLKIAKSLLKETGVIFISIDDNEQAQVKMLCMEIFGNKNFLQQIIVESNPRGSQSSKYFANTHEYLFVFSKVPYPNIVFGIQKGEDVYSEYPYTDDRGQYRLLGLRQRGGAWRKEDRPMLHYPIYVNPLTKEVSLTQSEEYSVAVIPQRPTGELGRWTWSPSKLIKQRSEIQGVLVNEGTVKEKWDVARKNYLASETGEIRTTKIKSLWFEKEINYQNGGTEVKGIIGDGLFAYPKPLFLLTKTLSCSTSKESIVLDFFAGSGTTLHAVMQLNAEDGGHRQCILCTNNENGICENVTYERNKRVIEGYTKPNGEIVPGLTDNNLRYYRTELLPRERSVKNMRELVQAATGLLCIKNDNYTETSFGGRKMNSKYARFFDNGKQKMLIIYEERAIPLIANIIKTMPEGTKIMVYVFSHGSYAYNDEFAEVADKVELCALPQAIYDAYQKVLPKRKPKFLPNELVEEIIENEIAENQGLFSYDNETGKGDEA